MNGDTETGVSIMYMVKQMDAGDVIDVVKVPITAQDNVGTMFDKLSLAGRDLLLATLPKIAAGEIAPVPQDEAAVSISPNITRDQQNLNFTQETAQQLDWHIRGLYPTHPAYVQVAGQRVKLIQVTPLSETTDVTPGHVVTRTKKMLTIAAADHSVLRIDQLQPAGKSVMSSQAYLNGAGSQLTSGDLWAEEPIHE